MLGSLDLSRVVGLRDRAVLGVLTYTGARVGALARCGAGTSRNRKRSGSCGLPKRAASSGSFRYGLTWTEWIAAYLEADRIDRDQKPAPLFLAADLWGLGLADRAMTGARGAADAQATAQGGGVAGDYLSALFPGDGGDVPAGPERAHGGRAVPGRTLQSQHHPALRPTQATGDPQYRRVHLGVKKGPSRMVMEGWRARSLADF